MPPKLIKAFAIAMMFCSTAFASENTVKDLKAQFKTMAKELESNDPKEIKAFLLKYCDKTLIESLKAEGGGELDAFVKEFIKDEKAASIKSLKAMLGVAPKVSDDKLTYQYRSVDDPRGKLDTDVKLKYSLDKKLFLIVE